MSRFASALETALEAVGTSDLQGLYEAVSRSAMDELAPVWQSPPPGKRAAYFSMEFLIGRVIYANLQSLGLLEEFRRVFEARGLDPNLFEQVEDAALGNGGLGRLAACYLESAATCGLRLDGFGIRYKYGLFKQSIRDGFQQEEPDDWTRFGDPWSVRKENERVQILFNKQVVWAVPYDMPVIGYGGKTVNTLRLWQAEAAEEFDFAAFNRQDYGAAFAGRNLAEAISAVLYPADDTYEGKMLRLKQQYFFSSASLQCLLREFKAANGGEFSRIPENFAIQLNDTHPAVAIPELLRLLVAGEGLAFGEALEIVRDTFCYTNHTIMAEALEKWDVGLFCAVIPEVYPYVVMLQNELKRELRGRGISGTDQASFYIVDENRAIHMARMSVFGSRSTNGVAALHTGILKDDVFKNWYAVYPGRFSNKTNGISPRRWLGLCNPELADFASDRVGPGWITDLAQLEGLVRYAEDQVSLAQLIDIKRRNKQRLAEYALQFGPALDVDSIFDVQAKRLHEYKRQLLNALSIVDLYFGIKDGTIRDFYPTTFVFAAKSAPGYQRAKAIIKYIGEVAKLVNTDPDTKGILRVVFLPNYNVSLAEKLIPAADIHEQISTAGTEASGTGNMKFMLNGAVTLGTYDGANIEIVREAGEENNFIFGARVEQICELAEGYDPKRIWRENLRIRRVVNTLADGTFSDGRTGVFRELFESLLEGASWHRADQYYLLMDFEDYQEARLRANRAYRNRLGFSRMCLLNTAHAGAFSSDRAVREYADEIWGMKPR